jgi:hypothetical protein
LLRRLESPFVLQVALSFHDALTVAQQAKAKAARVEAKASRPLFLHVAPRVALHPFLTTFSNLAVPLGGVAAAERQGALNALDMDCSGCGFDRPRSHPENVIKGANEAA